MDRAAALRSAAMLDPVPTRFAVIADIHGNADALSAVLADIDRRGIGTVVNLGDHFSGPLAAAETARSAAAMMGAIRGLISLLDANSGRALIHPRDTSGRTIKKAGSTTSA